MAPNLAPHFCELLCLPMATLLPLHVHLPYSTASRNHTGPLSAHKTLEMTSKWSPAALSSPYPCSRKHVEAEAQVGPFLSLSCTLVSPQWPLWVALQAEPTRGVPDRWWAGRTAGSLALDGQPAALHGTQQPQISRLRRHPAELLLGAHCRPLLQ